MKRLAVAVVAAGALAGCTSSSPGSPTTVVTGTHTVVTTRTVTPPAGGVPATSVAPFPSSGKAPKGEVLRHCPYLKGGLDSDATTGVNLADLEGDRVGAITVLTNYDPVGCRFYFSYSYGQFRHQAIADILPFTFATAAQARTAMIRTATAGSEAATVAGFVKGLTGISYRTRFFGPDGSQDWAFVFAKGRRMVIVHTQQTNVSFNAERIAAAIAARF